MAIITGEYALNFWIPVVFFLYGLILLLKPPAYQSRNGIATKRAMKNEKVWAYVHRAAGVVCIVFAAVLGLCAWATAVVIGGTAGYLVQIAIEVAAIAGLIPILNWLTDRKFDWQ